ncbi:pyrroline-5-carboxylate reductase [Bacillus kwashiorkori]|uniref:pyrroline-5-carboxylate reductase n=1 Tax=Bacillus kwashiorkori TaxID=1522318 RepID=UPI000780F38F|nr:pyrroline-5-carboxylate reductase [Bacillus kwashiorkori]
MKQTIGFIGCGNIAKSMLGGIIKSGLVEKNQVIVSNRSTPSLIEVQNKYGVTIAQSNAEVAEKAHIVFLTVTSDMYETVIREIKEIIPAETILIIVAAGESIQKCERRFNRPVKIVKAMPNTPSLVNEGITGIAANNNLTDDDKEIIRSLFACFGRVEFVDEGLMDVVTAVGGSSPAFTYMFIEALADGAVMFGMPRSQAYVFAAQAVLGAAKMMLETNLHPAALKDSVCSPGGTTIESVARLEERGLRSAVIEAVKVNLEKAKQIHG